MHEVIARDCPTCNYLLPMAESIDFSKIGEGEVLTTNTCNSALKTRRILVETVGIGQEVYEMDYMHHLRNVWFKGVEKAITSHLNICLKDSLDTIDSSLRVSTSMTALTRVFDKEFSFCANYPKGHGMLFCQWMKK